MLESAKVLQIALVLCAGVALEFLRPVTAAWLVAKDKYLEPMFAMLVKPEQKLLCRYCRLPQPQATFAQNPLLYVVLNPLKYVHFLFFSPKITNMSPKIKKNAEA